MKIDPAAWPFAIGLAVLTLVLGIALHPLASVPTAALLLFTLWFFRDPERRTPEDPTLLICPADGRIIKAGPGEISVFMNVFNVHVCRAPSAGAVVSVSHTPGSFLAAYRDEAAQHNERTCIDLTGESGATRFTLVAGLVARRIVCRVGVGQQLRAGQRVGLIRFGSRVDVVLPEGSRVDCSVGQKVRAGETVLARRTTTEARSSGRTAG